MGLKSDMTGVLTRKGDDTETHREKGEKSRDNRGRGSHRPRNTKDWGQPAGATREA